MNKYDSVNEFKIMVDRFKLHKIEQIKIDLMQYLHNSIYNYINSDIYEDIKEFIIIEQHKIMNADYFKFFNSLVKEEDDDKESELTILEEIKLSKNENDLSKKSSWADEMSDDEFEQKETPEEHKPYLEKYEVTYLQIATKNIIDKKENLFDKKENNISFNKNKIEYNINGYYQLKNPTLINYNEEGTVNVPIIPKNAIKYFINIVLSFYKIPDINKYKNERAQSNIKAIFEIFKERKTPQNVIDEFYDNAIKLLNENNFH